LTSFRNSSDQNAYAEFWQGYGSYGGFQGQVNGRYYSCQLSAQLYPAVAAQWPQAMGARGYFAVNWDKNGYCSQLFIVNGSQY
jgi:hypothetical protein